MMDARVVTLTLTADAILAVAAHHPALPMYELPRRRAPSQSRPRTLYTSVITLPTAKLKQSRRGLPVCDRVQVWAARWCSQGTAGTRVNSSYGPRSGPARRILAGAARSRRFSRGEAVPPFQSWQLQWTSRRVSEIWGRSRMLKRSGTGARPVARGRSSTVYRRPRI